MLCDEGLHEGQTTMSTERMALRSVGQACPRERSSS